MVAEGAMIDYVYVRTPNDEELQELKRMTRQAIGRVSQRAQMILLSAQRRTVPEIACIFDVEYKTVRKWLRRFDAAGPAGLYDEPRSGRPRKLSENVRAKLIDMIQQDPAHAGYPATFWTVAMLVLALADKLQIQLSASAIRQALRRARLAWGRPRLAMPRKTDPEKAAKQWALAQAVVDAGPEAAVLYADESRIELLPLLRSMWHWLGQQIRIPTPGSNVTRAIFGALNIRSGQWTYLVREHMYKEDFITFLEHLLKVYATGTVILIVDNYSSHTACIVPTWLDEHPRLRLYYLPKYCSHLDPVENIWLRLKGQIAANRLFGSMRALLDTVDTFFDDMTPERALAWADAD
jgi:transposase